MSQSKTKTTYLGLATGVVLAGLWIAISIALQRDDQTDPSSNQLVEESSRGFDPHEIRPSLIRFRDHPLSGGPMSSAGIASSEASQARSKDLVILLDNLPSDLSRAEVVLLFDWLRAGADSSPLPVAEHAHLANEVLNALHRQQEVPEGFAQVVIELANDGSQPDLVRDYAVQHLRSVWNDLPESSAERGHIAEVLWEQADSRHASRSGTALLALHQLGIREGLIQEGERFISNDDFASRLPLFLTRPDEPGSVRITALRIVAERSLKNHLQPVRQLIGDSSQNTVVRLRAIATLGSIGTTEDIKIFELLASEPRMVKAAASALKKLTDEP